MAAAGARSSSLTAVTARNQAALPLALTDWADGAVAGFFGRPNAGNLWFASGYVEGAAWRARRADLVAELRRARVPDSYLEANAATRVRLTPASSAPRRA